MKLLVTQFSPTSCHFSSLMCKYSPQNYILQCPQSTCLACSSLNVRDNVPHLLLKRFNHTFQLRNCVCFQNIVLPKLPVPSLEQTLERYQATVKPIVSDAQYERTRTMLKTFGSSNGPGPRLQEKLLQLREEKDNWVSSGRA